MTDTLSSPHLSSRGKEAHTYNAIVIGSGISGGWAAKELCEKGLKTRYDESHATCADPGALRSLHTGRTGR